MHYIIEARLRIAENTVRRIAREYAATGALDYDSLRLACLNLRIAQAGANV